VYETVKRIHGQINVAELLAKQRDNEQAGIKLLLEEVTAAATADVQSRWLNGPMKGVDLGRKVIVAQCCLRALE